MCDRSKERLVQHLLPPRHFSSFIGGVTFRVLMVLSALTSVYASAPISRGVLVGVGVVWPQGPVGAGVGLFDGWSHRTPQKIWSTKPIKAS